jgi:hypothetical protein
MVTLLRPTPSFLVLFLMIAYSKIFSKYLKDIPFVSLTKSLKNHFDSQRCCVATPLWPSVGVKPNTWKSWGFGILRDS